MEHKLSQITLRCFTPLESYNDNYNVLEAFILENKSALYLKKLEGNPIDIILDKANNRKMLASILIPPYEEHEKVKSGLSEFLKKKGFSDCEISIDYTEYYEEKLSSFRNLAYHELMPKEKGDTGIRTRAMLWSKGNSAPYVLDAILKIMVRAEEIKPVGEHTGLNHDEFALVPKTK